MQNAFFSTAVSPTANAETAWSTSAFRKLLRWMGTRREHRRARFLLSDMSDRELKDVGLVRSQIDAAVRASRR